ncbi:MAG: right-handed parallel beta-helix repeat-containing protein [Candidatus Gracilibacteria bacterium]|jgi:parallel beta-helix repeat protein|nr:right-handed parallel beta-helix repeat-containing protein [Candidatus Gracilibacteria bacterium]
MPKKKKKQVKKGMFKSIQEKVFSGISKGIEDAVKKFTVSILSAFFVAIGVLFSTYGTDVFKASVVDTTETLQDLIDKTQNNQELDISNLSFTGSFTINKNIHLKGNNKTILSSSDKNGVILTIENNAQVEIDGIMFKGAKKAVYAKEDSALNVKNSIFTDNQVGIYISNASDINIENSFIEGSSDHAIYISGLIKGKIYKNTLSKNRIGIRLENSSINITENLIKNSNDNGLYLFSDSSNIYKNYLNRIYYGSGVNFRKGTHSTKIYENTIASSNIGIYSVSSADTSSVSAYKNNFLDISENEIIVKDKNSENFYENQALDENDELSVENFGCYMEICL